jgi:Tol biopolymer transport system component
MDSVGARALAAIACVGVAAMASAPAANATFPGRNGGIAFSQRTGSGDSAPQIVEHRRLAVAIPGRDQPRILLDCELTDGVPSGGNCAAREHQSPSYSPDGSRIIFDAGERLALVNADGGGLTFLPQTTADDGDPVFSADGRRIAFTGSNDRGTTDLYVRRLDGGAARLIINDAGAPAWSSRGVIAYVRSGNIYVARPGGGHRRFVTSGVLPDWSPNGRRLLLVRPLARLVFDDPIGRMYVVLPSGRALRRVGAPDGASHSVWSPDGRSIAWDGFDLGVFAKRLGSSRPAREVAPTQISGESGFVASSDPAWRPL